MKFYKFAHVVISILGAGDDTASITNLFETSEVAAAAAKTIQKVKVAIFSAVIEDPKN